MEVRSEVTNKLAAAMKQVSSEFEAAPVTVEQACHLPIVADGVPVRGKVKGVDGLFVATGGGCWGILCGPATGLAMSELILDGEATSVDVRAFDPARLV